MKWVGLLLRLARLALELLNERGAKLRRAADQRASEAESYRETTKRMQDEAPVDTDPDAIRARLRNRPRDTR